MKKSILIIFIIAVSLTANSQQERHYSMFFANPVQLNPGAAGHSVGSMQIFTNYRTQWFTLTNQPYRSFSAGIDAKILDKVMGNGFVGVGLNFFNDASGDGKYTMNIISLPLNYSIALSKNTYLAVGVQPGLYAQKLDEGALYFENQWTSSGFDTGMSSGEGLAGYNLSRFDLSSGIFLNTAPSRKFNLQVGFSGFHLTAQEVGFGLLNEKLYRNFIFYSQANIKPGSGKFSIHPALFGLFQGPNMEITFGSNFELELKEGSGNVPYFDGMSLSLGLYYRTTDALVTNLIYNAGPLSFGIGYDFNMSGLKVATNGVGAVEFYLKFFPSFGMDGGAPSID